MGNIIIKARNTKNAPKNVGAGSQAIAFSHYMNISAQLPVDAQTGEIVGKTAKEQADQCLKNIQTILKDCDHKLEDVVKTTVFLKDMADLETVDSVYASYFPSYITTSSQPARTTVGVAALPKDALVQIEAVVSNGEGTDA